MDLRSIAADRDALLRRRLDEIVPTLMNEKGFEAWVVDAREYNEDPVAATMLPATWWATARRRTLLVFKDYGRRRAAIARYPVGSFPPEWDPSAEPDQWLALAAFLADVTGPVGINTSPNFALADGLTSTERDVLEQALSGHDLRSAQSLAIGWLETRLPEERDPMSEAVRVAHGFLRRALSNEVVRPGQTTTQDVAWWLVNEVHSAGYGQWFHPGVSVQRRGEGMRSPADDLDVRTIEPGDMVHIDFGIVSAGYHTDQQQHAYVLGDGETGPPPSLVDGLEQANRLQDILMSTMMPGRSGNEVLASSLGRAREEGLRPIIYTHPIGLHGHAAGATIGLWDNQESIPDEGDHLIAPNTAWSIELAVEIDVDEWDGQTAKIMLEEDAFLGADGIDFLDGRQAELWVID